MRIRLVESSRTDDEMRDIILNGSREDVKSLLKRSELPQDLIKLVIKERRDCLSDLAATQKFSDENAKLYIDSVKDPWDLEGLYITQRLSLENLKRAIRRHSDFGSSSKKRLDKKVYRSQIPMLSIGERREIEEFISSI